MSWGSSIKSAWQGASQAAQEAAQSIASGVVHTASKAGAGFREGAQDLETKIFSAAAGIESGVTEGAAAIAASVQKAFSAAKEFGAYLVGNPVQICPQMQKKLIERARKLAPSLPPDQRSKVLAAADRLSRDQVALERAKLAEDVYNQSGAPPGWERITDESELNDKYGISLDDLQPPDSNFRAALYKSTDDGTIVLAFKGTDPTDLQDWKNNLEQALGLNSDYYNRAINLAKALQEKVGTFEITGHSLGGGMAAAASMVTGEKATTFNTAGVSDATVERFGVSLAGHDGSIDAYNVEGDILTNVQALPFVPDAAGDQYTLPQSFVDRVVVGTIPVGGNIYEHLMGQVTKGFAIQEADDVHVLETYAGAP